jgi:hypothetical protein
MRYGKARRGSPSSLPKSDISNLGWEKEHAAASGFAMR